MGRLATRFHFLRAQGIQDTDIATIDDPAIAITAIRAHRAIENESAMKDEMLA